MGQPGDTLTGTSFNGQSGTVNASRAGASAGLAVTGPGSVVLTATSGYGGGIDRRGWHAALRHSQRRCAEAGPSPLTAARPIRNGAAGGSVGSVTLQKRFDHRPEHG